MNGTGFFLAALLLVVLIAVVLGAQQTQDMQAEEFRQLMQQRDQAVALAQEAKAQRDQQSGEVAALKTRLGEMEAALQKKDAQIVNITVERDEALKVAQERQAQAAFFQQKTAELQQQVNTLMTQNAGQVPVTGGKEPAQDSRQPGTSLLLPFQVKQAAFPIEAGLVALIGLAALGGGGYIVIRHDEDRRSFGRKASDRKH